MVTLAITKEESSTLELRNQISFRIRTLDNNTQIFYLGSKTGKNFLTLRLVDGRLVLQIQVSNVLDTVKGPIQFLSDGSYHYIDIQRDQTMIEIRVDNEHPTLSQLSVGSPLQADILLLGGMVKPKLAQLSKRQIESSDSVPPDEEVVDGLYKGILQDFRLNGKLVPFYEVSDLGQFEGLPPFFRNVQLANVLEGIRSDQSCRNNPCQNGGSCEVTWNDFK